ncbi:MAG: hypothetical protein ABIO02_04790 [Patescibacteria group bacterium]
MSEEDKGYQLQYHRSGKPVVERQIGGAHPFWKNELYWRDGFVKLMDTVFPRREIIDVHGTLDALIPYMEQGNGVIFASSHPTRREAFELPYLVFTHPYLRDKFLNSALAKHQYKHWLAKWAELSGQNVVPIVTQHSSESLREERGGGLNEFLDSSVQTLAMGGVEVFTPQGERRATIGKRTAALFNIMNRADEKGVYNYAVIPVGVNIEGVTDYSKARGFVPFKNYQMVIGELYERDRIYAELEVENDRHIAITASKLGNWFNDRIQDLTPPSYHA